MNQFTEDKPWENQDNQEDSNKDNKQKRPKKKKTNFEIGLILSLTSSMLIFIMIVFNFAMGGMYISISYIIFDLIIWGGFCGAFGSYIVINYFTKGDRRYLDLILYINVTIIVNVAASMIMYMDLLDILGIIQLVLSGLALYFIYKQ